MKLYRFRIVQQYHRGRSGIEIRDSICDVGRLLMEGGKAPQKI